MKMEIAERIVKNWGPSDYLRNSALDIVNTLPGLKSLYGSKDGEMSDRFAIKQGFEQLEEAARMVLAKEFKKDSDLNVK